MLGVDTILTSGQEADAYAGRELVVDGNETVWLAECGSKREDGTFEAFCKKLLAAKVTQEGEQFNFASPGSGMVRSC